MPRTATVTYEDITIEFARPTITDGQLRTRIFNSLKGDLPATRSLNVFIYVITQIVSTQNYDFKKMESYPGDEAAQALLDRFERETDELLMLEMEECIYDLNGLRQAAQKKSGASVPLSRNSSEVENQTPIH